jgi:hypothetical protein
MKKDEYTALIACDGSNVFILNKSHFHIIVRIAIIGCDVNPERRSINNAPAAPAPDDKAGFPPHAQAMRAVHTHKLLDRQRA